MEMEIYEQAVRALNASTDDTFLVVCGGIYDAQVFRGAGFSHVTISNLSKDGAEIGGYPVVYADAESLSFADRSFDWAVVHAGLHHCASPHRGLLELLRVARRGVLVIESRDSFLMRLAAIAGFTADYEIETVVLCGYKYGGMRNSPIPNYIYRWTEREIEKTVASAYPSRSPAIEYIYNVAIPTQRMEMSGFARRAATAVLGVAIKGIRFIAPRQCNQFAFIIRHDAPLQSWMADDHGMKQDLKLGFDPKKYWRNR